MHNRSWTNKNLSPNIGEKKEEKNKKGIMKNACIYWDFEVEQRSIVTMHNGDSNNYECVG